MNSAFFTYRIRGIASEHYSDAICDNNRCNYSDNTVIAIRMYIARRALLLSMIVAYIACSINTLTFINNVDIACVYYLITIILKIKN